MPTPFIIGVGAGLVAATLFASAATATAFAGVLFYLVPLPLCLAGLGWGSAAGLISALVGSVAIGIVLGPVPAAVFALIVAAPIAFLAHLALLSRPAPPAPGAPNAGLEWYPPGRLLGWAVLIAGTLAALLALVLGHDQDNYREAIREVLTHSPLKDLDTDGTVFTEENLAKIAGVIAWVLPAAFAAVWLTVTLFNLWLAGRIVEASGRALRPWPDLHALELPNAFVLLFAGAFAASFLPGLPGLMATGLAGALLFAYALQGLAVIHVYSLGMPLRSVVLATVYLAILFLGWVVVAVAILGLAEPSLGLRRRAAQSAQPPKPGGTI